MEIIIKNIANVPNKYVHLLKSKLENLAQTFKTLTYLEAFMTSEGMSPKIYKLKLRFGVQGYDSIIVEKGDTIIDVIQGIEKLAHLRLSEK